MPIIEQQVLISNCQFMLNTGFGKDKGEMIKLKLVLFCINWKDFHALDLIKKNARTWHLHVLLVQESLLDFLEVACKDSCLLDCSGAVAQARSGWLLAHLRIIGDNNFPSLNSYFGLSTCSNSHSQVFTLPHP